MRRLVVATAVLVGLTGTAMAQGYFRSCSPIVEQNGCDVSPTTYRACLRDIRQDVRELNCNIRNAVVAAIRGRTNISEAYADAAGDVLADLKQDLATLSTLQRNRRA